MLQFADTNEELRRAVDALRAGGLTLGDREKAREIVSQFFGPVDDGVYALFLPDGVEHAASSVPPPLPAGEDG